MKSEKEIKNLICKTIAKATGTPNDFQEGHCTNTACDSCIFDTLSKEIYKLYHNSIKEFAKRLKEVIHNDDFEQLCQDCSASEDDVFNYIDNTLKEFLNNE